MPQNTNFLGPDVNSEIQSAQNNFDASITHHWNFHVLSDRNYSELSLAVLQDGRLAVGSDDGNIRIWDDTKCQKTLFVDDANDASGVHALVVLPGGTLASGSEDGKIRIWDTENEKVIKIRDTSKHSIEVLTVLPDGRLASGSEDGNIRIWNTTTDECTTIENGSWVTSLAVLADGRLASGSDDGNVRLWDTTTGFLSKSRKYFRDIISLAVLPDGITLAIGSLDINKVRRELDFELVHSRQPRVWTRSWTREYAEGIRLLNTDTWEDRFMTGHTDFVNAMVVLPDGRLVSSGDTTIKFWNITTGECTKTLLFPNEWHVNMFAVLQDGSLASCSHDGIVRIWCTVKDFCFYCKRELGHSRVEHGQQWTCRKCSFGTKKNCKKILTKHYKAVVHRNSDKIKPY